MIERTEILELAAQLSLQPHVVEKDYVLGWILAAVGDHQDLRTSWVFKGGTCLKKVYFETYRFSEDLDFTLRDESQVDDGFLRKALGELATSVYERTGIEIPTERLRVEVYTNPRGRLSAECRLYYRGPLAPTGSLPAIRLDLTADEVIVLEPERRRVRHPYSDEPEAGIAVLSYPLAEVFAEKIRALGERGRPRDLYDVVHLYRHSETRRHVITIRETLEEKCRHKGIPVPDPNSLVQHHAELQADWGAMLRIQLQELPPVDSFWDAIPEIFGWLAGAVVPIALPPRPIGVGEEVVRAGLGELVRFGGRGSVLETVRFAAANRLLVELHYVNEAGESSSPVIEPYSLRRTTEGHILLHAERPAGRGHRAYRVDRIRAARVTDQVFEPRFAIELTPSGYQPIPESSPALPPGRRYGRATRTTRRTSHAGVRYVYECGSCGKRFTRYLRNPRLRPHKSKGGWACGGRIGWLVDTRY